jgi:hypothetical protein
MGEIILSENDKNENEKDSIRRTIALENSLILDWIREVLYIEMDYFVFS